MKRLQRTVAALLLAVFGVFSTNAQESVTLEFWQIRELPAEFYERFSEQYPHIDLQVEFMGREDMRTVIGPALGATGGPDFFSYTPGPGFGGALANAGLLLPLDEMFESKGWAERFYPWTYERETYNGTIYGIGDEPEILGVFYHKDVFEELSLEVPSTVDEFLGLCEALQAAGYFPVAFGNRAGWPAYHVFSLFANNIAGLDKMDEVLLEGGSWDQPEFVEAVRVPFEQMVQAGCYAPGINGISYDESNMLFYTRQAAMNITGMWLLDEIIDTIDDPDVIGFFPVPAVEESGPVLPPAGIGTSYYVAGDTQHPEEVALALDFLFSYEIGLMRAQQTFFLPPFALALDDLDLPEVALELVRQVQNASLDPDDPVGYNIDVLTGPRFNRMMADGFQMVIDGTKTPEQQVKDLQQAWEQEAGAQ